jgi:hypothetical protein
MAFTVNKEQIVVGNKRAVLISCSVDSSSGNVDTGLSIIDGFSFSPVSCATGGVNLKANVGSGATSRPGILNINSFASGDSFFLVVYGR